MGGKDTRTSESSVKRKSPDFAADNMGFHGQNGVSLPRLRGSAASLAEASPSHRLASGRRIATTPTRKRCAFPALLPLPYARLISIQGPLDDKEGRLITPASACQGDDPACVDPFRAHHRPNLLPLIPELRCLDQEGEQPERQSEGREERTNLLSDIRGDILTAPEQMRPADDGPHRTVHSSRALSSRSAVGRARSHDPLSGSAPGSPLWHRSGSAP